jgi:dihydroorotase
MHSGLVLEDVIEKLTAQPRRILRLSGAGVQEGSVANLTFFDPHAEWVFGKTYSKSKNTPFLGQTLRGKVRGVINNGKQEWFK